MWPKKVVATLNAHEREQYEKTIIILIINHVNEVGIRFSNF